MSCNVLIAKEIANTPRIFKIAMILEYLMSKVCEIVNNILM